MVNIRGQANSAKGFVAINFPHTTPFDRNLSHFSILLHCCLIVLFELVLCQVTLSLGTYLLSAVATAASPVRLSFNSPYSSLTCFPFFHSLSLSLFCFLVCYILMQTHISCFINSSAAIKYATHSRNMWELQV